MSIEPGAYQGCRAKKAEFGHASTGTEQIGVEIQVSDGNRITWYGFCTDASIENTVKALRVMGCQFPNGPDGLPDITNMAGLGTTEFDIVVVKDVYNGKTRTKVQYINEPGGGGPAMKSTMDDAKKLDFRQRMAGALLKAKAVPVNVKVVAEQASAPAGGAAGAPEVDEFGNEIGGDEIPW